MQNEKRFTDVESVCCVCVKWPSSTSSLLRVDALNPEGMAPMADSTSVASICHTHKHTHTLENVTILTLEFLRRLCCCYLSQSLSDSSPVWYFAAEKHENIY